MVVHLLSPLQPLMLTSAPLSTRHLTVDSTHYWNSVWHCLCVETK